MEAATSAGPRVSDLSSSSVQSSTLTPPTFISNYSETIRALSKPGTKDAATTDPPTTSSSASSPLLQASIALLTSAMSLAQTTPLTPSHVAYIPPHVASSLSFPSPPSSNISSSMLPARRPPNTSRPTKPHPVRIQTAIILGKAPAPPAQSTQPYLIFPPSSQHPLSNRTHPSHSSPPTTPNQPQTSIILCPHCTARDHLTLWHPITMHATSQVLSQEDVQRIYSVISFAWRDSTKETYGSGLLIFHTFCDIRQTPEDLCVPTSKDLISAFVASLAGTYTAPTITNYVNGVHNWHIVHGLLWEFVSAEASALLKVAKTMAPTFSKCPPQEPYTIDNIIMIREQLSLTSPLNAAVFTCLTTLFFATTHTGEFTVPNLNSFNPSSHITCNHVSTQHDRNGLEITNFQLPRTKSAPLEEDVNWAKQDGPSDPQEALLNHFLINDSPGDAHLFTYREKQPQAPHPQQVPQNPQNCKQTHGPNSPQRPQDLVRFYLRISPLQHPLRGSKGKRTLGE